LPAQKEKASGEAVDPAREIQIDHPDLRLGDPVRIGKGLVPFVPEDVGKHGVQMDAMEHVGVFGIAQRHVGQGRAVVERAMQHGPLRIGNHVPVRGRVDG
jgi:hypothetical protein